MKSNSELAIVLGMGPKRGQPPTLPRRAEAPAPEPERECEGKCAHTSICPFFKAEGEQEPEPEVA